ncbi:bifunctional cytidylyltransferase/SDR family oxidoreductase [Glycomyces xiaoerkulensis]|uniref:bifunctional cytidylyltransferase/SDR family oxidoreductase n=1 Tax=Glycomyces xiaoerkulensis TaxID=2038139 RepID=UPI0018E48C1C|nr:bifunctional cytidylyltransferase/SDR family oxidoreductase [Glycomyces xiaoerkulensis]
MSDRGQGQRPGVTAVVLAGGTGQRVGLSIPKQLIKIAGKPVIQHTLEAFQLADEIDDILVLMAPGYIDDVRAVVEKARLTKVVDVIPGGGTRSDSTKAAVAYLEDRPGSSHDRRLIFHDAVRPLISGRVISETVAALERYDAVDVAIPSSDTVIVTRTHGKDGEFITDVPDRARLRRGQTPQAFKLATIRAAYREADRDPNFKATDDCSVVLKYLPSVPVHVVTGDEWNLKVTQPVDLYIADKLFQLASTAVPPSTDEDYRTRLAGKTLVVFGGSYGIGGDLAELAESYGADVYRFARSTTGTHVENPDDIAAALKKAHQETGRIDYVVNTAGVLQVGRLNETGTEDLEKTFQVNYLAPVQIAREAFPYLAETQGQLLYYTSSSYTRGRANYSLYSSTKAALVNLTQALSDEWSDDGIQVNCINPERTATPMRTNAFGREDPETLLDSAEVARTSLDVLLSSLNGAVIDVRREDPTATADRSDNFEQAIARILDTGFEG